MALTTAWHLTSVQINGLMQRRSYYFKTMTLTTRNYPGGTNYWSVLLRTYFPLNKFTPVRGDWRQIESKV